MDELRERREQLERLPRADDALERSIRRAQRWDRIYKGWTVAVTALLVLAGVAYELYREWWIWNR